MATQPSHTSTSSSDIDAVIVIAVPSATVGVVAICLIPTIALLKLKCTSLPTNNLTGNYLITRNMTIFFRYAIT